MRWPLLQLHQDCLAAGNPCLDRLTSEQKQDTFETQPSGQLLKRQSMPICEGASRAVKVASTDPPYMENLPPTLGSTCRVADLLEQRCLFTLCMCPL